MSSKNIQDRLKDLQGFTLYDLHVEQLETILSQINEKIESLDTELKKIERGINIFKIGVFDKKDLLPSKFSSPLRQVLSKGRDLSRIEKLYDRYTEEKKKLSNIINEKKLEQKQIELFRNKYLYQLKQFIVAILIVFVLGLMVYQFNNANLPDNIVMKIFFIDTVCCMIFLANFFFELFYSSSRTWYWKTRWIDFITSIPLPPSGLIIRLGRLARLARLARIIRVLRLLRFLKIIRVFTTYFRGMEALTDVLDMKLMKKTISWSIIVTIAGSFTIYYAEKDYADFNNWFDGLWWGITTILTGGFADLHNPATLIGTVTTTLLILSGMILIGVFVASLSSVIEINSDDVVGSVKNFIELRFNELDNRLEKLSEKVNKETK
jgi:voltage-gated potassium channel